MQRPLSVSISTSPMPGPCPRQIAGPLGLSAIPLATSRPCVAPEHCRPRRPRATVADMAGAGNVRAVARLQTAAAGGTPAVTEHSPRQRALGCASFEGLPEPLTGPVL